MQKMENEIADRITPIIEKRIEARIKHRIVQSIVDTLDENFYPPEEMIKEEYIKQVEDAQKEEGLIFNNTEELKKHLESLEK